MKYSIDDLNVILQDWDENDKIQEVAIELAEEVIRLRMATFKATCAILTESNLSGYESDDYVYDTIGSNMAEAYFELRSAMNHEEVAQ